MKLGLVQTAHNALYDFLSPTFSLTREQCLALREEQFRQNLTLLETAAGQGFDLLVTTECINSIRTGPQARPEDAALYPGLDSPQVAALGQAARRAGSWLVAGFGYRRDGTARNGALIFDRTGALRTVYDKVHLAGDEAVVFAPGQTFCTVDADFGRFGVCVCWDMQFPETARMLALQGASLVVCPTWGWEADLYGRARAYENGIFAAAAMAVPAWGPIQAPRTPSSAVAPDGSLICLGPADRAAVVCCTLDLTQAESPRQLRLGDRRPALYGGLTHDIPKEECNHEKSYPVDRL